MSEDYLTGRYYFKQTWFGLVLIVEYKDLDVSPGQWTLKWRKAKAKDLVDEQFNFEKKCI